MFLSRSVKLVAVTVIALSLAACKSDEERAEEFYQSGIALIEAGDTDRAIVEFRNVFEFAPNHIPAREAMGAAALADKDFRAAYGHYLRIAEQNPNHVESRIILSEIAFSARNWEELDRHGAQAEALAADDPRVQSIVIGRAYRKAVTDEEETAREGLAMQAAELAQTQPDSEILRNILIDDYTRRGAYTAALAEVDALLVKKPDDRELHDQRIILLVQIGDEAALEAGLQDMVVKFADDQNVKATLLRYYLSRDDLDKAEAFLREISDPAAEDRGPYVDLIRFLAEVRGPEAAREAIGVAIAQNPNPAAFRALQAGLDFSEGNRDAAIAEFEDVLSTAEPSNETNSIRVTLARLYLIVGNEVGARRLVAETLADDPSFAEALKIQAAWQIAADDTDGAIASLRTALDANADDTDAMQQMAAAYTRAGNHDLSRDFLARAVEASNNAPDISIRYARVLIDEERYLPAEDVLIPALRLTPGNPDLLAVLGELYLLMDDQPRTQQVIDTLRRQEDPSVESIANALEAELLSRSNGVGDAVAFLESLADSADGDVNAQLLLLRGLLSTGDGEGALALSERLLADNPEDLNVQFARAATQAANGDLDGASAGYEGLLALEPTLPRVWLELSRIRLRQGDLEATTTVINDGLAANPDDPGLLWAKASVLERQNDIDGAIEIYEALYARSSNSAIVANNLASLLSAWRDDAESLERAFTIARRFAGAENPALQDTYGWIVHRRGDSEGALPYLESAAAGLTQDAITQYHLAAAYAALGRAEDAIAQLQRTLTLAGPADTRPQIEAARALLAELQAGESQDP